MKMKHLISLLLLCTVLCACQSTPPPAVTDETPPAHETQSSLTTAPEETTEEEPAITAITVPLPDPEDISFFRDFMDDTNRNGQWILSGDEQNAPGTPDDPATVPQSDRRALFGTRYELPMTNAIPDDSFCYYVYTNPQGARELAVLVSVPDSGASSFTFPLLLIFDLGTIDNQAVCEAIENQTSIPLTLVYACNIAPSEFMYMQQFLHIVSEDGAENLTSESVPSDGILVGQIGQGDFISIYGTLPNEASARFEHIINLYYDRNGTPNE